MKFTKVLLILAVLLLSACGQKELGFTIQEFDQSLEKLYGKSPEEVIKVFGKPVKYSRSEDLGKLFECFTYDGVKDPATGKLSTATTFCFLEGRLKAEKALYSF